MGATAHSDRRIAAQLAAEDFNLSPEGPDAGVPTSGASLNKEVRENVKPPQHSE
jgi:hypothetical protein